jgi:uncharacterized membrane protein
MSALQNAKGGLILVGVRDDGTIEGLRFQKQHEEYIMNIASENCAPPIRPYFEKVTIPNQGDVYVIRMNGRINEPFHGVKTRDGLVYFVRVGSTIREMQPHEFNRGKSDGVKIEPYTYSDKGLLLLTEKMVASISKRQNWRFSKTINVIFATGLALLLISMGVFLAQIYGKLGIPPTGFPIWAYILIAIVMISGAFLIFVPRIANETRCPACKEYFKFKKVNGEILKKRTIEDGLEELTVRYLYRCDICKHEEERTEYEKQAVD